MSNFSAAAEDLAALGLDEAASVLINSGTLPVSPACATATRGCVMARLAANIPMSSIQVLFKIAPLCINPALANRVGHAINSQHVRRNAVIYAVGLGIAH